MLYEAGLNWPEVERGELVPYVGRRAFTTIGYAAKLGLHVALLDANQVARHDRVGACLWFV